MIGDCFSGTLVAILIWETCSLSSSYIISNGGVDFKNAVALKKEGSTVNYEEYSVIKFDNWFSMLLVGAEFWC